MTRRPAFGPLAGSSLAVAAAALAVAAAPAPAAGEGPELVLSLGAGIYVPTQDNGFIVNDPAYGMTGLGVATLRPGVDLEVALGAWWGLFGAQIGVGYLSASQAETSVGTLPVTALLRVRLPLRSVSPYVEGGAGICFASATTPGPAPPGAYPAPLASYAATTLEWIAGVGAELGLGSLRLGASARYLWIDPSALSAAASVPLGSRGVRFALDGLTATVSVGYQFPLGSE